jgi:hypothetical protein
LPLNGKAQEVWHGISSIRGNRLVDGTLGEEGAGIFLKNCVVNKPYREILMKNLKQPDKDPRV